MTLEQCFHLPHTTTFNGPRCIFELRTNYNSYLPVPCTFKANLGFHSREFPVTPILLIFDAYTLNDVILDARSRKWRPLYWKNEVPFLLHLGFCWNFIPHTVHECARTSVGLDTALHFEDTFSAVSWLPLEGFSWNCIPHTSLACAKTLVNFVAIGQYLRALYW
jgi:hypothetical protein